MGNQNRTQRSTRPNQRSFDEEQSQIIDLDGLISRSILLNWSRTRKKKTSRFKQEDLLVTIDWKEVLFKQDPIRLLNSSTIHRPRAQILYRTIYENQTTNEHFYNVRTERTTCSTFRYLLTHTLLKSNESLLTFRLPDSISGTGIGISREHPLIFGRDVTNTKDYQLNWPVDTQIRVCSRNRASVELFLDEDEFHTDFLIPIRFSGRLTATITTRQWPHHCLKIFENDVVSVVRDILKNTDDCGDLEIRNERSPYVFFTLRGKCSFRYGVKQSIFVRQESFDNSSMYFSDRHFLPTTTSDYNCFTSTSLGTTEHTPIHPKHLAQL